MENLTKAVENAIKDMEADGIIGWGLNIPSGLDGYMVETSGLDGCTSDTCLHNSHSPAAPYLKWVPEEGRKLILVGKDDEESYYWLQDKDVLLMGEFFKLIEPKHFHARLIKISSEEIPAYMLAKMAAI